VELLGIGSENLRKIAVDENYQVRIDLLEEQIKQDKVNGFLPFCIVGNAGTVNTGAIDDLETLASIAKREGLWFHIDGAFGAVPKLLPEYTERLKGVELADSIAFDYHKWFYVNYDVGGVLIRNPQAHKEAFEINASYLAHHERGIIAGDLNYNHLGIELSRGFRALKVWMMLKEQGLEKYSRLIRQNIQQARYLAELVQANDQLQLMAPVPMNIVCFRFYKEGLSEDKLNALNKEILMQLHESGIAAPSFTIIKGAYVIRVAITNHRSKGEDFEILVNEVQRVGEQLLNVD
jgi:glutamate/tyrosine decarboxylase-like PLP-dependent enzyme